MKTHFATVEYGNESNPSDEWGEPICGTESEDPSLSNEWMVVDCKRCLKLRKAHEHEMKLAMEHNCRDMAGFVKFMEREQKLNSSDGTQI